MKKINKPSILLSLIICITFYRCESPTTPPLEISDWQLGTFKKLNDKNPVLGLIDSTLFFCPILETDVAWEAKDVFNPTAIVVNDTLFMLYRAEDSVGRYNGTSRIGIAWSLDGTTFHRDSKPILYPDNDFNKKYEWEGGIEDPRIVATDEGFVITYSSYEGKTARLCVASSSNLRNWEKHGPVFSGEWVNLWSKAGSIVSDYSTGSPVAKLINGQYWMYWGDTDIFLATSDDLIHWSPLVDSDKELIKILSPRKNMFDSRLVESGPPAMFTEKGIVLLYNGMNLDPSSDGDPELKEGTYSGGQALFDREDPTQLVDRTSEYFITPDQSYEIVGQIGNVCFIEGLVKYKGNWWLYYGTADSKIAVAVVTED